ncbi:uncharacterized protein LOC114971817 [Acropora millepora]|uniref:uncharacterized protein LOC114971817 n=1 Tax=Acropora millepora TaxID=45264 RepID=UPI001CF1ED07|nr:uncharacterized protein LOC114971817 [Acropora millepora]
MYDIACILSSHLKNSGQEELLSDVGLAIPIFHCYGHKASCQVQFSPRRTPNIGLTDGEGVERFWSYLRQFSTITKEMSVDKRVDVLTDASLHYGEHLFYRFVPTMIAKLKKASTLMSTLGEEISRLVVALPDGCDLDTIRQWMDNEISEIVPTEKDLSLHWDETYVELLVTASKLKTQIAYAKEEEPSQVDKLERKMLRNERTLVGLEKKHGIRGRWQENDGTFQITQQRLTAKKRTNEVLRLHKMASERIFLLELKAKYAEGQAIAIKLSNQIDKVVNSMKQGLATLNGLMEDEVATFEDIKDPGGKLYCELNCSNNTDNVPAGIKKKLVHLMFLEDSCKEEKTLVKEEMLRFFTFLSAQINAITSYLDRESANRGLMSLLQQKVDVYKKNLQLLTSMCKDLVIFPNFEEPEETYQLFSEVEVETATDVENLYDFSLFEDLECHSTNFRGWNDEDFD